MNNNWQCTCGTPLIFKKKKTTDDAIERYYCCSNKECNLIWYSAERIE